MTKAIVLQHTPTVGPERVAGLLAARGVAHYVRDANGPEGGAKILAGTERFYARARPVWDRLLGNILDLVQY